MREKIFINDIVVKVDAMILHQGEHDYVRWAVSSGLMSDVLTTEETEILLISSLSTTQVVRTADMVGANAILLCCGKQVSTDTLSLAQELNITLLSTENPVFETCHLLSEMFYKEK